MNDFYFQSAWNKYGFILITVWWWNESICNRIRQYNSDDLKGDSKNKFRRYLNKKKVPEWGEEEKKQTWGAERQNKNKTYLWGNGESSIMYSFA